MQAWFKDECFMVYHINDPADLFMFTRNTQNEILPYGSVITFIIKFSNCIKYENILYLIIS